MQKVRLRSNSAVSPQGGSALLSFRDAALISASSICALLNKEWAQSTSATSGITAYGNTKKHRRSRFTYSQRINHHG